MVRTPLESCHFLPLSLPQLLARWRLLAAASWHPSIVAAARTTSAVLSPTAARAARAPRLSPVAPTPPPASPAAALASSMAMRASPGGGNAGVATQSPRAPPPPPTTFAAGRLPSLADTAEGVRTPFGGQSLRRVVSTAGAGSDVGGSGIEIDERCPPLPLSAAASDTVTSEASDVGIHRGSEPGDAADSTLLGPGEIPGLGGVGEGGCFPGETDSSVTSTSMATTAGGDGAMGAGASGHEGGLYPAGSHHWDAAGGATADTTTSERALSTAAGNAPAPMPLSDAAVEATDKLHADERAAPLELVDGEDE